jgi:hypothetical protein
MSKKRVRRVLAALSLCLGCAEDAERPEASDSPVGVGEGNEARPSQGNDGGFGGGAQQGGGMQGGGADQFIPDRPGLGDQPGQTGGNFEGGAGGF